MLEVESSNEMEMWKYEWVFLGKECGTEFPSPIIKEGLQNLLRREWFSRIWVIQEAALAKAAIISSGRNNINSQTFSVMPKLLRISCNENVQSRLEVMPGLLRKISWWSGPESQELDILLKKFGKSKAKDPRDIIYALLGLSEDAYTSDILRPDYQIDLQEAIQHTVFYILSLSERAKRHTSLTYHDLPKWNMGQFMLALDSLPGHVHKWITKEGCVFISVPEPSVRWADVGYEVPQRHMRTFRLGSCSWIEITDKMMHDEIRLRRRIFEEMMSQAREEGRGPDSSAWKGMNDKMKEDELIRLKSIFEQMMRQARRKQR